MSSTVLGTGHPGVNAESLLTTYGELSLAAQLALA